MFACPASKIADRAASRLGVMYIVGAAPSVHSKASHCGSSENLTTAAREANGLRSATSYVLTRLSNRASEVRVSLRRVPFLLPSVLS